MASKSPEQITIPIFKGDDPFYGMNTDIDATALRKGEYPALNNVRGGKGSIKIRGGIDAKGATGITAGTYRGRLECTLNGTYEQLVAVETGGATRLYYGPDTAFSELSASSGKYGNTRLGANPVEFVICRDVTNATIDPFDGKSGRDLVVASDGTTVVVWDPSANECVKHAKVTGPSKGVVRQEATFPGFITLSQANTAVSDSNSGVETTTVDNAALPTYLGTTLRTRFIGAGAVAGSWGQYEFTTGDTICSGTQVKILFSCTDTDIWNKIKVSLYDGTSLITLYDPATDPSPDIIPCTKGTKLAVFTVDTSALSASATYTRLRYTYATGVATPAADIDLYTLGVYGGGKLPGGTSLSLTRFNSGSRSESHREVCIDGEGKWARALGLQDVRNDVQIPISADCLYAYDITTDQPTNADRDLGIDWCLVYALLPNTTERKLVGSKQLCAYGAGAWVHSGSRVANQKFTFQLNSDVLFDRTAPDDTSLPMPPFKCAEFSGSRLWVGAAKSVNAANGQSVDVFISEQSYPFRFLEQPRNISPGVIDPSSGTRIVFSGEIPKQIRALSSQNVGAQPVLIWTERSLWMVDGTDAFALSFARKLGPHGTLSPRSVAVWDDRAFWLDQNKQLKTFDGQIKRLSYRRTDAPLNAIPDSRLAYATGMFFRDEYFLAYTVGGGTSNGNILVYDAIMDVFQGRWPSNYEPSVGTGISYADFHAKGDELRFWDETGVLYQHDSSQADDEGTAIPINVTTPDISLDMWKQSVFGDVGIIVDDMSGKTLTATWTGRTTGGTSADSTSIDESSDPMCYRWIGKGNLTTKFGLEDVAASVAITGGVLANKKIVSIVAKLQPGECKADAI